MKIFSAIFLFFITILVDAQVSDFKTIDFSNADNVAKINNGESLQNLPLLAYKLTHKLPTDVEKFRAIYTWVSTNIKGDDNQHRTVTKNRVKYKNDTLALIKWNNEYKKKAFKKLLKRKRTMCTGYAYLIKELAAIANIECKIIDGYGRTVTTNVDTLEMANHSWNAVKLNNKWYLCDATWSSGYMQDGIFIKNYNDGYFLTEPKLFAKNHFPLLKKWLLTSNETSKNFVTAPIIYGETFKHKVVSYFPSAMRVITQKNKEVTFKFKTLKNIAESKISLVLFSGVHEKQFDIYDVQSKQGVITFKNKFKYKGYYDVHLKIGDDIVATYTFKVI